MAVSWRPAKTDSIPPVWTRSGESDAAVWTGLVGHGPPRATDGKCSGRAASASNSARTEVCVAGAFSVSTTAVAVTVEVSTRGETAAAVSPAVAFGFGTAVPLPGAFRVDPPETPAGVTAIVLRGAGSCVDGRKEQADRRSAPADRRIKGSEEMFRTGWASSTPPGNWDKPTRYTATAHLGPIERGALRRADSLRCTRARRRLPSRTAQRYSVR